MFIVNHPVLDLGDECIGCSWGHVDDTPWDKVAAMELITGNFEIGIQAFVPRVIDAVGLAARCKAIASRSSAAATITAPATIPGRRRSPIGSPTTLVLADNLSEAAIVEAIRKGRTIVQLRGPDDPFMELTIDAGGGKVAEIGDDVMGISEVTATAHVVGGDGMFVQLWRDGKKLDQKTVAGADVTVTFSDTPGAEHHRYRLELINDLNQRVVVTSHIYVDGIAADDGCGCRTSNTGGTVLLAFGLVFVLRRPRRRRTQR